MKLLPTALVIGKNMLASNDAWLLLVDISIPTVPATTVRLVRNNEDITFEGNVYTAFPFDFAPMKTQKTGEIPTVSFKVSNVTRALQVEVEDYDGLVGQEVTLYIVNSALLSENYTELTWVFTILTCSVSSEWISFGVGAPNPLRRRFPLNRYLSDHCVWRLGGAECKYAGVDSTCKRTLSDCQSRTGGSNSFNFGGHVGLGSGGIRVV